MNYGPVQEIGVTGTWLEDQLAARVLEALGNAASTGTRTRVVAKDQVIAMIVPCTRDIGPDVFRTIAYGNSYPELIEAAIAEARGFYGPDAPLVLERAGAISRVLSRQIRADRGEYTTEVVIRCTQLPDGWDVP